MGKRKGPSKAAVPQIPVKRKRIVKAGGTLADGKSTDPRFQEQIVTRSMTKEAEADSPAESTGIGKVHPLLIENVLETVFKYLIWPNARWPDVEGKSTVESRTYLWNIRLVSKRWNETASKLFRRGRAVTCFGDSPTLGYPRPGFDFKMYKFLDVFKTSSLILVQRFRLASNFFVKENQSLLKDFMRVCGATITDLSVQLDNRSTMELTRRSFPGLQMTRLKRLVFLCENYRGKPLTSQSHLVPYLIELMLDAVQNLEEFRLEIPTKEVALPSNSVIVKRFGASVIQNIPESVKVLRLDVPLSEQDLYVLLSKDLKLDEFHLDSKLVAGADCLTKFLTSQSYTLRKLVIVNDGSEFAVVEFPRFHRLTHLKLAGLSSKPFGYANNFPDLQSLDLSEWRIERTAMDLLSRLNGKKATSSTIKEIHLPFRFPQAPFVRKTVQCFPNLKSVHVSASPDVVETLQEVFVHCRDIEELHITLPFFLDSELNVDSIFTGVSELDYRRIMRHRNFQDVSITAIQNKPSIENLTKLKKLVLGESVDADVLLSDFAVHFSFLKMDSLKELCTNRFRMSSRYVQLLRNKLKLTLFDDDGSSSDSSDESLSSSDDSFMDDEDEDEPPFRFFGFGFGFGFGLIPR